ncbi:hypothetical protein MMC07_001053 [Pseudocyphellaria aurata]|nr:hypothetical protein [Pseudocyphellaria aurata]
MDAGPSFNGNVPIASRRQNRRVVRTARRKGASNTNKADESPSAPQAALVANASVNANTRVVNGGLEYRSDGRWIPAIYHNDIRGHLLAEAPQGTYDVPRSQGKGADDVTSFHPDYEKNGPDRHNRHKILFVYEQLDCPVASYNPETWMYRGKIVLDQDDYPVRKWHEIPLVLSSAYDGYDMEVVRRLNPSITYQDIRARMPRYVLKGTNLKSAGGLSTLSMRNARFRDSACCLAWVDRKGNDRLKEFLDKILPEECLAANSTEGFRDLTAFEVAEMRAPDKGRYLQRAGPRALDKAVREKRNEGDNKRLQVLKAEHERILGPVLSPPAHVDPVPLYRDQKRKRACSSLDREDEEESFRPTKRQARAVSSSPTPQDPKDSGATFLSVQKPDDANAAPWRPLAREHSSDPRVDFRFVRPTNTIDELSVHMALQYTRDDCRARLGANLELRTTPSESYAYQYREIEDIFNRLWRFHKGKAPRLIYVEAWGGGFDGWKRPDPRYW